MKLQTNLLLLALLVSGVPCYGENLLLNGDFESGNLGFGSDYDFNADLYPEGRYYIGTNPQLHHAFTGANFGDHTTGSGLMLIANGQTSSISVIWRETLSLLPGSHYSFQGFTASWGAEPGQIEDTSPAVLQLRVDSHDVGSPFTLPSLVGNWVTFSTAWTATQGQQVLEIVTLNTALSGNDFVLDDLSVTVVPEPSVSWLVGFAIFSFLCWNRFAANSLATVVREKTVTRL